MRRTLALLPLLLLGCPKPTAKPPPTGAEYTGPIAKRVATAKTREKLAVTIYNQDFGLVREVRSVDLAPGRTALELQDVAARIQPETVHVKALLPDPAFGVLEQNFRYDLLTPAKLLQKYVGKTVKIQRWNSVLGKEEDVAAKVLAAEPGQEPVFEVAGEVTYGYGGRISFPELPENLVDKPTLVLLLGAEQPKQKLELAYATSGMGWKADYVATVSADDSKLDLTGWVTLDNRSGAAFLDAELKLVAGDVQKFAPPAGYDDGEYMDLKSAKQEMAKDKNKGFSEESLFEYHLYTLGRPTTLLEKEQKQVTLLEAASVPVKKHLVFSGQSYWYRSKYSGFVSQNQKVAVFLDFENKKDHHLGVPLPKGIVRVYKADKSGAQQFIGEDRIDHTATDEKVRVKMGEAFDVVADRKQMSWHPMGTCNSESEWEISIRNHKDVAETVEIVEPAAGDWEIMTSSHPATKVDAHTFTFTVNVPKNGATKVTYRVAVKWC
ncbi:MAG: DUF4139 domain-containing protein [Myxococcales bacterium]|nr:DUF4139 domain-containing protein [Myxococcales bacterium]